MTRLCRRTPEITSRPRRSSRRSLPCSTSPLPPLRRQSRAKSAPRQITLMILATKSVYLAVVEVVVVVVAVLIRPRARLCRRSPSTRAIESDLSAYEKVHSIVQFSHHGVGHDLPDFSCAVELHRSRMGHVHGRARRRR